MTTCHHYYAVDHHGNPNQAPSSSSTKYKHLTMTTTTTRTLTHQMLRPLPTPLLEAMPSLTLPPSEYAIALQLHTDHLLQARMATRCPALSRIARAFRARDPVDAEDTTLKRKRDD
jgi:hypothetical protein